MFNIFDKFSIRTIFFDDFLNIFNIEFEVYKFRKNVIDLFNIRKNRDFAVK